jgi:hypothetical protein
MQKPEDDVNFVQALAQIAGGAINMARYVDNKWLKKEQQMNRQTRRNTIS